MAQFELLRVPSVGAVVAEMDARALKKYEAAREQLRGEGCSAGGKRLLAADPPNADYALCQRSLYGAWRMITAYRDDRVVIVHVGRHTDEENPRADLAELFPGLSATGRKRSAQPPCCDDPDLPPTSSEVDAVLAGIFGF